MVGVLQLSDDYSRFPTNLDNIFLALSNFLLEQRTLPDHHLDLRCSVSLVIHVVFIQR